MQIAPRSVVSFHYTLTHADGQVIDSSQGKMPLTYLHGSSQIVAGLEKALTGRRSGDSFKVEVSAAEGYGEHQLGLVQAVPREAFQGVAEIQPGMQFQAQGPQGAFEVTVVSVDPQTVTVDGNHPLAGKPLHFAIEITDVREASEEEIQHGHVHGPGAHSH